MNYIFRNAVLDYANGGDARVAYQNIEYIREVYPPQAFHALMNLLSIARRGAQPARLRLRRTNSDPPEQIARAKQRLRLAVFFQMMFPGAPAVYYGDEVGVTGGEDPYNRAQLSLGRPRWQAGPGAAGRVQAADRDAQGTSGAAPRFAVGARAPGSACDRARAAGWRNLGHHRHQQRVSAGHGERGASGGASRRREFEDALVRETSGRMPAASPHRAGRVWAGVAEPLTDARGG